MKIIDGGITAPKGFKAASDHVGIKKAKKDMVLIASDCLATVAACFTKNIVKAAPVVWDEKIVEKGNKVKGIIVNSGNANACTGQKGFDDVKEMSETFGNLLGCSTDEVLVCSTGVIGVNLPMDVIKSGIEKVYSQMGYDKESGLSAAEGILTTDTFTKTIAVEIEISGKTVTIAGMAKGSGMIHPNMATMLSFVTTDVAISKEMLQKALSESVIDTYNMISVDGDTSTNDTILVLANGLAQNEEIISDNEDFIKFKSALNSINKKLAIDVARDGEGATKLMEVTVKGASTDENARKIAKSIVSSTLFKAALFGEDANWGRVLCAMGYGGGEFDPLGVTITFKSKGGEILLMEDGKPISFDEEKASAVLKPKDIYIFIDLKEGENSAVAWGCDLSYDYVKINGDYRS